MIKRRYLLIIPVTAVLFALIWYLTRVKQEMDHGQVTNSESPLPVMKYNGRRILNLPPGREKEVLEQLKISNSVSKDWQQKVEEGLKIQGGDSLKGVSIKKVESAVWLYHGVALNVESIEVTLMNEKGERTSFRALVDSQNGKILQTWDHPVYDPVNPHDKQLSIKVDPRYHND